MRTVGMYLAELLEAYGVEVIFGIPGVHTVELYRGLPNTKLLVFAKEGGKDVLTLMREITLPQSLAIGESYGRLIWSIRGIYEGYVGWYDGNPSTMFGPPRQAYGEVVKLAGGPDAVASRAGQLAANDPVNALYLTDMALAVDPAHRAALEARLKALQALDASSNNSNERGWLQAGIREVQQRLKR